MEKLNWKDVAHYYLHSRPQVYFPGMGVGDYMHDPKEGDLPLLREWESITDEEAFEFLNLVGDRFGCDEVEGAADEFKCDYAYGIDSCKSFEMTAPALHWFISHNFNPFGVEVYKGGDEQ